MSLIQLLKLRKVETELYKIQHLETPHLQIGVFKMEATVASGHCLYSPGNGSQEMGLLYFSSPLKLQLKICPWVSAFGAPIMATPSSPIAKPWPKRVDLFVISSLDGLKMIMFSVSTLKIGSLLKTWETPAKSKNMHKQQDISMPTELIANSKEVLSNRFFI